jgi:hypothetical protein
MLNLINAECEIKGYKPEISKRAAPYNDLMLTAIPKRRSCSDLTVRLFPAIHIKKRQRK